MRHTVSDVKLRLWFGNVEQALVYIEDCLDKFESEDLAYEKQKKFRKHVDEFFGPIAIIMAT